jgi:hypothetical protein
MVRRFWCVCLVSSAVALMLAGCHGSNATGEVKAEGAPPGAMTARTGMMAPSGGGARQPGAGTGQGPATGAVQTQAVTPSAQ